MTEGGGKEPPDRSREDPPPPTTLTPTTPLQPMTLPAPAENYQYNEATRYLAFKVIIAKPNGTASAFEINNVIKKCHTRNEIILQQFGKRIIAYCGSAKIANNLTTNQCLKDAGYNAYIPLYYVATAAIVWDVDTNISDDWLLNNIEAPGGRKVLRVFRMKRKITTNAGTPEWIPARRIKIFIEGFGAPQRVFFDCISCQCNLYVKKYVQCGNCYKFNHTASRCVNEKICKGCGRPSHDDFCENLKCAGCGGNHPTSSPNCTAKIRQRNINQAMAEEMLSWDEANRKFPVVQRNTNTYVSVLSTNPYAALSMEEEDFPPLPEPKEDPQQKNQQTNQPSQTPTKRKNNSRAVTQPKKTLKSVKRTRAEEAANATDAEMQEFEEYDSQPQNPAPLDQREDLHRKLQDARNRQQEKQENSQRERTISTNHQQQEQFFVQNLQSVSEITHPTQPPAGGPSGSTATHGGPY